MQMETSIEAITEFSEVAWQMLAAYRVIGPMDGILDIADHGVYPLEDLEFVIPGTVAGYYGLMVTGGICHPRETIQAIGNDEAAGAQMLDRPRSYFQFGKTADLAQFQRDGVTLGRDRQCSNERHFA